MKTRVRLWIAGSLASALALAAELPAAAYGPSQKKSNEGQDAEGKPADALPKGHPAVPASGKAPAVAGSKELQVAVPPSGSGTGDTGLTWTVPGGWTSVEPATPMRKAQYKIPGPGGDAEMIVYYFGPNEGGGAVPNAQRWAGQFTLPDGKRGTDVMKLDQVTVDKLAVVTVATHGTYAGDMATPGPRPNYMLLGAIAQGPDANWFFKLTGPRRTVEAEHRNFNALVASLRSGGEAKRTERQ